MNTTTAPRFRVMVCTFPEQIRSGKRCLGGEKHRYLLLTEAQIKPNLEHFAKLDRSSQTFAHWKDAAGEAQYLELEQPEAKIYPDIFAAMKADSEAWEAQKEKLP